ncbi:MAG: haloacid dehalogenase [bacterium]|nr:haloacid dehalogenase [bacterium]MCX7917820.1 haloacid dehalogenase [bacterium]MDW8163868.1 haloacid dehalogenase [Candidatus Omnitrophota bacterium]
MEKKLEKIASKIIKFLEEEDKIREESLKVLREITRTATSSIKKIHNGKFQEAKIEIENCLSKLKEIKKKLKKYPEIYYQGFLHQAEKEVVEAKTIYEVIFEKRIPKLNDFDSISYLHGLAESLGEIRRYILDKIREKDVDNIERYLKIMDDIYFFILNFQYPEAITRNLRRQIDYARGIIEKTRGEVTTFYLFTKKEI